MKFFQWEQGRSEETKDIKKMCLWSWLGFDIYLLRFPKDCEIGYHVDEVPGKEHRRFNLTLKGLWLFKKQGKPARAQFAWSWHVFRPDIEPHAAIVGPATTVLSIGCAFKKGSPTRQLNGFFLGLLISVFWLWMLGMPQVELDYGRVGHIPLPARAILSAFLSFCTAGMLLAASHLYNKFKK